MPESEPVIRATLLASFPIAIAHPFLLLSCVVTVGLATRDAQVTRAFAGFPLGFAFSGCFAVLVAGAWAADPVLLLSTSQRHPGLPILLIALVACVLPDVGLLALLRQVLRFLLLCFSVIQLRLQAFALAFATAVTCGNG